eukprot:7388544-Prymnesium_polylepis.1
MGVKAMNALKSTFDGSLATTSLRPPDSSLSLTVHAAGMSNWMPFSLSTNVFESSACAELAVAAAAPIESTAARRESSVPGVEGGGSRSAASVAI